MSIKVELPTTYHVPLGNEDLSIATHDILGGKEKYCNRREQEVIQNLRRIKKIVSYIAGVDEHTNLSDIGPLISMASLEDDGAYYQEMRLRCNEVFMPLVGLDPDEELDVANFETLFTRACAASDEGVKKGQEMMEPVVDAHTKSRMDMMQESTYADTPLLLLENIFRDGEPKRSYESMRKFMMAMRMMPELINQDRLKIKGIGNDIFNVLTKRGVFGNEPLIEREIIAKVYTDTGECVGWETYDDYYHDDFLEGSDTVEYADGHYENRPWKQMLFSLPSRQLKNGLPVHVKGRGKEDASTSFKVLRKLETSDDHFAIRLVFDEKQADITTQIATTYQNMIDTFEQLGWSVELDKDGGYTNTIAHEMNLRIKGEQITLKPKKNGHNSTTSSARRAVQIDWVVTTPAGRRMQFEVQSVDTIAELNRQVNSQWNDASYKVTQFLEPFKYYNEACIANALFPPYYMGGIDVTDYAEDLYTVKHIASIDSPSNNKLPPTQY